MTADEANEYPVLLPGPTGPPVIPSSPPSGQTKLAWRRHRENQAGLPDPVGARHRDDAQADHDEHGPSNRALSGTTDGGHAGPLTERRPVAPGQDWLKRRWQRARSMAGR